MAFFDAGGWIVIAALAVVLGFLPALLRLSFEVRAAAGGALGWQDRAFGRFRPAGLFAWTFAWCKMRLDPMFGELPEMLKECPKVREVLDLGCGNGVAGCAVLAWLPEARVLGVDPNPARVRVARLAYGARGGAAVGGAPDFVIAPAGPFDVVLVLDVIHFISDAALETTLARVAGMLAPGGRLILRAIVPAAGGASATWRLAAVRRRISGARVNHRSAEVIGGAIARAGLEVVRSEDSGGNQELRWFIASSSAAPAGR